MPTSEDSTPSCSQTEQLAELLARKKDLIKLIQGKEESLRKLNLVKMYRNKASNYFQLAVFLHAYFFHIMCIVSNVHKLNSVC